MDPTTPDNRNGEQTEVYAPAPAAEAVQRRPRGLRVGIAIGALAVVGAAGFGIGFQIEKSRLNSDVKKAKEQAAAKARKPAVNAPGGQVVGKVKSVDQGLVTITKADGKDQGVYTNGATVIDKATHGTSGDITQGSTILVQGKPTYVGINATEGEVLVLRTGSKFATSGGSIVGQVKTVGQDSITITRPNGTDLRIHTTTRTVVDKATAGSPGDIAPGSTIFVQGKLSYVGINATEGEVLVLPAGSTFGTDR